MGRRQRELRETAKTESQIADVSRRRFVKFIALAGIGAAVAGTYALTHRGANSNTDGTVISTTPAYVPTHKLDLSSFTHADCEDVTVHRPGEKPIIFIPWLHPLTTTQGNMFTQKSLDVVVKVRNIAKALHDVYGINGMVSEGLRDQDCAKVMRGGKVLDALAAKSDLWTKEYDAMLHDRRWMLCGSKREGLDNPLQILKYDSYRVLDLVLKDFNERGWSKSKEAMAPHLQEAGKELYVRVFAPYANEFEAYLAQDPGAAKAYVHQQARDDGFIEAAERALAKGANGCIILSGAGHEPRLKSLLAKTSHAYAVVRPKDVGRDYVDDEEASRKVWLQQSIAYGKYMQIHGTGFSVDVMTGLMPVYQRLGILPPDAAQKTDSKAQGTPAAAQGTGAQGTDAKGQGNDATKK